MNKDEFKNLIAFCILMQNGEGIITKSPDYVLEKYERYLETSEKEAWKWGLHPVSQRLLNEYIGKWGS